jgi:hypothetical protein
MTIPIEVERAKHKGVGFAGSGGLAGIDDFPREICPFSARENAAAQPETLTLRTLADQI